MHLLLQEVKYLVVDDFKLKSARLSAVHGSLSWSDFKKMLKDAIYKIYRKLRPGGTLFVEVRADSEYDLPTQVYTYAIACGFFPIEKVYVEERDYLYIVYIFAKVFFPRRTVKYATKRGLHFQPYNVCTKSREELERSFHDVYSAFQYKSSIRWLSDRLLWNRKPKAEILETEQEMEDLQKIGEAWESSDYHL